jgi:plastocyanin
MIRKPGSQHVSTERAAVATGFTPAKTLVVLGLMAAAFLGAYNYAVAGGQSASAASLGASLAAAPAGGGCGMSSGGAGGAGGSSGGGGGCCGGGGPAVEGAATVAGDVQTIDVDTSQGSFNPNVIKVKAGIPIEMNFSQAPGGCLSGVYFPDFNINEDLTGGPKSVKLPALEKGEYGFYCQMQMVSAKIVVE